MAGNVAELKTTFSNIADNPARAVGELWTRWNDQRQTKIAEWKELRNYLFATDTTTTSNASLPWKNKTTLPKLCQIRDNLHANYISSLMPNTNWLKWEAYSDDDNVKEKADAITAYIQTKARESNFRDVVSKLTYDFIDYGNAFAEVEFVNEQYVDETDGSITTHYIGPRARRISPMDIVFNPVANTFEESPKIIRRMITLGEMKKMAKSSEEWETAFRKTCSMREYGGYSVEDFNKAVGFQVDGFGNLYEYYQSGYVEVLEFIGDFYNPDNQELRENQRITVIDRSVTVRSEPIANWLGKSSVVHAGWRYRPDNLWGMGPLDNLVGLQYRIDHLENLKADAMDLSVHPPLVIKGDVDPFNWGPGEEIYILGDGEIEELGKNLQPVILAENTITVYENKMEEFAGAPKQAMGVRTPGEKTAYEVQSLENAAGRIFQEKVVLFETNLLEPLLNLMLECARRNMDGVDVVRVFDDDFGAETFMSVTKEDIVARGKIQPIGARHFGEQAQLIQNLAQTFSSGLGQVIAPHISSKQLAKLIEDALQLGRWKLVRPNVALVEQAEAQKFAGNLEQMVQEEQATPVE